MLFKNLWIDPKRVISVFCDHEAKRARVVTDLTGTAAEVTCDLESAQLLIKFLQDQAAIITKPK